MTLTLVFSVSLECLIVTLFLSPSNPPQEQNKTRTMGSDPCWHHRHCTFGELRSRVWRRRRVRLAPPRGPAHAAASASTSAGSGGPPPRGHQREHHRGHKPGAPLEQEAPDGGVAKTRPLLSGGRRAPTGGGRGAGLVHLLCSADFLCARVWGAATARDRIVLGGGWTSAPAFSAGSEPTSPPVDPGPRLSRFVSPSSFAPRSVHPHFLCGRRVQRMAGRSILAGRRRHASAGAWDPARLDAPRGEDDLYNTDAHVCSTSGNGTEASSPEATGEPSVGESGGFPQNRWLTDVLQAPG